MKLKITLFIIVFQFVPFFSQSQATHITPSDTVRTLSGGLIIGQIINIDSKSIEINTNDFGIVSISQEDVAHKKGVTIITNEGDELYGDITYEDKERIVLYANNTTPITIQKSDINYRGIKDSGGGMKRNAVSANLLGVSSAIGVTYERLFSQKFGAEIGVGFYGIGAGLQLYPTIFKEDKAVFHTGLSVSYTLAGWDDMTVAYIPIGFSKFNSKGFRFGIDIGPALLIDEEESFFYVWGNLKLGFRF